MEIIKANSKGVVEKAIKIIKDGGVVVFPTDTVYGLLADASNDKAVEKVFNIKKRFEKKAIAVFVDNIKTAKKLAIIDQNVEKLLEEIWPGKVTVIFERRKDHDLSKKLFGGSDVIGIRIPKHNLINKIIKEISIPLTTSSANISGKPDSTKIKQVLNQFKHEKILPDLIIDAGNLPKSQASTVIKLTKNKIEILREGDFKLPCK